MAESSSHSLAAGQRRGPWSLAMVWMATVGVLLGGGCSTSLREWAHNRFKVGPNYARPPAPVAPTYLDAGEENLPFEPACDCAWWTAFNDPTLNGLIETAYRQNLDLRVAGTRILEARAQQNIAIGNLFPQSQSAMGAYAHGQITENLAVPVPSTFDFWATGFNATWEFDFWGRYRRSIEAANAEYATRVEAYGDTLIMLLAEVATAYVQLRTYEERIDFARHNVEIQKGSLGLAENRFSEGVATELDVRQARTSLAQTEAAIPPLEAGYRQASNRLCILLGMPVNDLAGQFAPGPIPHAPPKLAVGVPADLLRRRPDVRQAERQVAYQSAQIGVAEADLYPRFALNGFLGYAADDLERLFASRSFTAFVIPTVQWNVLNYGRIANNIAVQDVRLEGAALQYQQTVLKAGGEVEDALIGFIKAQQQAERLEQSVRDAERSVELVLIQFKGGIVDFNRVYNTQSTLVSQQDQLAVARGEIALNLIRAYKALGGGWQHFFAGCGMPAVASVQVLGPGHLESLPSTEPTQPVAPPEPLPMDDAATEDPSPEAAGNP